MYAYMHDICSNKNLNHNIIYMHIIYKIKLCIHKIIAIYISYGLFMNDVNQIFFCAYKHLEKSVCVGAHVSIHINDRFLHIFKGYEYLIIYLSIQHK